MPTHYWSMAGLTLDIVGAFFLAVEAIKLENLAALRDRFLIPFHINLRPKLITYGDDGRVWWPRSRHGFVVSGVIWLFWHFVGGALLVAPFLFVLWKVFHFDLLGTVWNARTYLPGWARWPVTIWAIGSAISLTACFPGELMHKAVVRLSRLAVEFFFWIDRSTPNGTIGIIGFLLLFGGFIGQMVGAWLGRST